MSFAPTSGISAYLPTSRNFEVDEEQRQILHRTTYTDLANGVNLREIGTCDLEEIVNGQQYFTVGDPQNKRFAFRKSFQVPAIVAGGTTGFVPHGITGITIVTHVFGGVVTSVPDFRPLPYSSVTANANIEVVVNATSYRISNGAGGNNITSGILVIEYLKQ